MRRLLAAGIAAVLGIAFAACGGEKPFKVGLIIKQDTNPFFREIGRPWSGSPRAPPMRCSRPTTAGRAS
jgi:hypothetical protein